MASRSFSTSDARRDVFSQRYQKGATDILCAMVAWVAYGVYSAASRYLHRECL